MGGRFAPQNGRCETHLRPPAGANCRLWEQIHNPNFKPIEFDRFKTESGDNVFTLTQQQWIKATDATVAENNNNRMLHNKKENEMYADLDEILQWAENNYVDVYMPIISRKEYKMVDRALRLS